jgi:hypothetical protein
VKYKRLFKNQKISEVSQHEYLDNQIEILKEVIEDHPKNNIDDLDSTFHDLMKKIGHSKPSHSFLRVLQKFQTFSESEE